VAAPRPGARLAPGQPIASPELEAFIDGTVREAMAAGHVAGLAVAVVQNGQVVLEKGYGLARTRPQTAVDPNATLFRLGSVSKTFTWLAVLKQAEAGRINLDQPINAYLPPELKVPDEGFTQPVRVRDLMAHSAGFEDRELGRLFVDRPDDFLGLDEFLAKRRPHRVRPAGELSTYSNYGAGLAGAAVAHLTNRPFEDVIETEVLRPMELADTTFRQPYPAVQGLPAPMPAAQAARLSESFLWTARGRRILPVELVALSPAAGASASADDMARYMLILLSGGKTELGEAFGPRTAQRIHTNLARPAPGLDGWDYGFMEYSLPGGFKGFGHDGATLGFRVGLVMVPELNLGVFVAGNTDTAEGVVRRLPGALVQRFYAPYRLPPASDAGALREAARGYTGLYLPTRRAYHGLEGLVGRLTRMMRVSVGSDGRLVVAQGPRARLFTPDGPPGQFKAVYGEDRIAFQPADGHARSFFLPGGQGAAERVDNLMRPEVLGALGLLAIAAALLSVAGVAIRGSREGRESRAQTRATWMEAIAAVVWLAAAVVFGLWMRGAGDAGKLMYGWPDPLLVAASSLAMLGAVLTLLMTVMLRKVWAGERRIVGWSGGRKLRHSLSVLVYLAFSVTLAAWGGLAFWTS
jgi:CubicO group peptidase (beta-lactamase class C family)